MNLLDSSDLSYSSMGSFVCSDNSTPASTSESSDSGNMFMINRMSTIYASLLDNEDKVEEL